MGSEGLSFVSCLVCSGGWSFVCDCNVERARVRFFLSVTRLARLRFACVRNRGNTFF